MSFVNALAVLILGILTRNSPSTEATQNRAERLASQIWDVVTQSPELPFDGDGAREATAAMLLAIAHHESGLREDIEDCSRCDGRDATCDRGKSIGMYQLHQGAAWFGHPRASICADNELATALALKVLLANRRGGHALAIFNGYASGNMANRGAAAARISRLFGMHSRKLGVMTTGRVATTRPL